MIRNYSNTVDPTSLSSGLNNSSVTISVASTTGFPPTPFIGSIDRGTPDEEVVLVTGKTATTFTVTRGYDGTSAVAHLTGAAFEHVTASIEYREANEHINDDGRDDHPQYFNLARAKAYFPQSFTGSSPIAVDPIPTGNTQTNHLTIPAASFSRLVQVTATGAGNGLNFNATYWFTIRNAVTGIPLAGGAARAVSAVSQQFTAITEWYALPPGEALTVGSYIRRHSGTGGEISSDVNLNTITALAIANV